MKATQCSVEGCDRTVGIHGARGLCSNHYKRLLRTGTTDPLIRPSIAQRLAVGLVRMPNGCMEWTRAKVKGNGYGTIRADGKMVVTHRLAWELANGPIPDGLWVLHHCDNPPCCQTEPTEGYPDGHLFLGTHADNMADMAAKGRHPGNGFQARTHCPAGHPYDEANTYVDPTLRRNCRACRKARGEKRIR